VAAQHDQMHKNLKDAAEEKEQEEEQEAQHGLEEVQNSRIRFQ
jgi:hypothetical protein